MEYGCLVMGMGVLWLWVSDILAVGVAICGCFEVMEQCLLVEIVYIFQCVVCQNRVFNIGCIVK